MRKEQNNTGTHYADRDNDEYVNQLKKDLLAKFELLGKQQGTTNYPVECSDYRVSVHEPIEYAVQAMIDGNQRRYLPISGSFYSNRIEKEANKKVFGIRNTIDDNEHEILKLENELRRLEFDKRQILIRKLVTGVMAVVSAIEGVLSYPAFRHASFSPATAFVAAIAVAISVMSGTHISGGYIKKSKIAKQWVKRLVVSFIPAVIGFYYLGCLRANAANDVMQFARNGNEVAGSNHSSVSAFAITAISSVLYLIGLIASAKYYFTKEERLLEQRCEELLGKIAYFRKAIADKKAEIISIEIEKNHRIEVAFATYEYAFVQELGLINFANELAAAYREKNLRHRTDGMPPCFINTPPFNFNRFFDN